MRKTERGLVLALAAVPAESETSCEILGRDDTAVSCVGRFWRACVIVCIVVFVFEFVEIFGQPVLEVLQDFGALVLLAAFTDGKVVGVELVQKGGGREVELVATD